MSRKITRRVTAGSALEGAVAVESIRARAPAAKQGPPPGTAADWMASSSSRLVAPCSMARRMWATMPSSLLSRNARTPMMTISRYLIASALPSPTDRSVSGLRAFTYSGSSRATHSQKG